MSKQLLINSEATPSVVARQMGVIQKNKPTGNYAIETPKNAYWVQLWYGMIVDAAPVIREAGFLRANFQFLLAAVKRREGKYEFFAFRD